MLPIPSSNNWYTLVKWEKFFFDGYHLPETYLVFSSFFWSVLDDVSNRAVDGLTGSSVNVIGIAADELCIWQSNRCTGFTDAWYSCLGRGLESVICVVYYCSIDGLVIGSAVRGYSRSPSQYDGIFCHVHHLTREQKKSCLSFLYITQKIPGVDKYEYLQKCKKEKEIALLYLIQTVYS